MGKRVTDEEAHNLVAAGLKIGLTRPIDWLNSRKEVKGKLIGTIFRLARSRDFFGFGSWAEYLKQRHGVLTSPAHQRLNDAQLHSLVRRALKIVGSPKRADWGSSSFRVAGYLPFTILDMVSRRKARGNSYLGTGSWVAYLAKHHNVALETPARYDLSSNRVDELVRKGVKKIGRGSAVWFSSREPIEGVPVNVLYKKVLRRPDVRQRFQGLRWKKYLEWLFKGRK